VRERTRVKNRIHGHLTAENLLCPTTDLYGKAGRAWLAAVRLSPMLQAESQRLLRLHDVLTQELHRLDGQVKRVARGDPVARRLATIPGVGVFGALFLHAEIGQIERFGSSHQLAAYAGLVPTTRSLGGKTTHGPLAKASNHWLKWILVEIVQTLKLAEAGARSGGHLRSPPAPREGEAEGDDGRGAEAVLLPLLDVEGRPDIRGVAAPAPACSMVGGAPDATFGSAGVAGA
jgi:transposase